MPNRKRKQINIGDTFRWTGQYRDRDRDSIWRVVGLGPSANKYKIECIHHNSPSSVGYMTTFRMDSPEWEPYDDFDSWVREVRANHANGRRSRSKKREGSPKLA